MIAAPIPANEAQRLQEIEQLACSYAPREERFDRITRTVCELLSVPIALVTVIDKDIQWLRSVQGLGISHTARDISFCAHVVAISQPLIVNDALKDERFHDNPLVTGPPYIRAYAGVPLRLPSGVVVGSLCAIDTMPRTFGRDEVASLSNLAEIVLSELQNTSHATSATLRQKLVRDVPSNVRGEEIDFTTGRWNRAGLLRALQGAMTHARQEALLALAVIRVSDIDWSRHAGSPLTPEKVLGIIGQHIQRGLPEAAILTRPESDIFCVVLPGMNEKDVNELLRGITEDVELPASPSQPLDLSLRLRCGVTWFDARDFKQKPDELVQQAIRVVR